MARLLQRLGYRSSMPKSSQHRPFLTRALALGLAAIYLFTNVASVHATESVFWGERRRAARARFQSASAESGTPPLYAQLPKTISATPDFSTVLDRVSPQTAVNIADLGKAVAQTTDPRILDVAQGILPYGNIRFVRESKKPGAPLILHIQDVHGNLEAQKNMADMILALARDHGVQLAGLEGATGAFATDEFKPYPDQEAVKKVAAFFMKKDILGGPEYAALASEKPLTLWGIEDPALYQANVKAVKESLAGRIQAETFLASLNGALDKLKKTVYTEDLQSFDKNQTLYDQDHRGLGEYVHALANFDGRTDVVHSHEFPNISRLLSALREEKSLDFALVERERQGLVEKLVENLSQAELEDLLRRSVDLRGGKTSHNGYHAYLQNLCARKGLSLSRYPSLTGYMHYVAASETIDREELLKEMGSLETSAQDTLTKTPEQRKLANLSRDASLLKKLIANEMTPDAWVAYKARQTEIANLPARLKELDPIVAVRWPESMTQFLSPFESFCARAMDRNAALTSRLLEKMTQDKHPVAVLVAGGFHTEGLMDILAKQGASVAVLTPKIGQVDPNHRYLDAFAQDPLPLEKIFNGEPISMKTECPMGRESTTGVEVRKHAHEGILAMSLERVRIQRTSMGVSIAAINQELVKLLDIIKSKVQALNRLPSSLKAVTSNGVEVEFNGPGGKIIVTAEKESISVSQVKPTLLESVWESPTLREEWRIAWQEKFNFLSPIYFFGSHTQWKGIQNVIGGLLILGLWLVMAETATAVVNLLSNMDLSFGDLSHSAISMTVGLMTGFFATLPAHAGWNLFAEKTNAVFKQRRIHFRLPRLTVRDEIGENNRDFQHLLLTEERRQRNESIAKLTKGRSRVLYLMAGFDLNNLLTTWPDASEVVMLGDQYIKFSADRIRNAMQSETLLNEVGPYMEDVLQHGNGDSLVLENEEWQIPILALELLSLGVDPNSVEDSVLGGITFSYIGSNHTSRKVEVKFINAHLGPKEDSEDMGPPAPIDLGQGHFDGVYFKAGYQFGGNISPLLEQVASNLSPEVTLVLTNNLNPFTPREPEASAVAIPGFTSNFQASFQSSGAPYANTFNVYTIRGNSTISFVDQSNRDERPITDSATLETEIAKLEGQLSPMLRFLPGKIGFHARVLETEKERRKIWYFLCKGGLDLNLLRNTFRFNVQVYGDTIDPKEKRFEKGVEVKLLVDVPQQNFNLDSSKAEKKGSVSWVDWEGKDRTGAFYSKEGFFEASFIPPQAQFLSVKMTSSETKPFLELNDAGEYIVGNLYIKVLRGLLNQATLASRGIRPNFDPLPEDLTTSYITPAEETCLRFIVGLEGKYPFTRQWAERALWIGMDQDQYLRSQGRGDFIRRFSLDVSNNDEEALEAERALKGFDSIFGNITRWRDLVKKTETSTANLVPGALGVWDKFSISREWSLAQRGWAEGWGTGMLYLVWLAGAMAFGFIPLAPPGLDVGSLLAFTLTSIVNPSLAFGVGIAVLSLSLHRLTGVKLRILDSPVKDWSTVLVASFKSLSGLAGVPLIGVCVSLAAMGGAFGLPWMILGVAAGAFLVRYGIQIGAETHQRINEQVESPPLNGIPAVLEIKKISETGSQEDKNRLNEKLGKIFLSGPARPVWFDFNDLKREYHVSAEKPKNAREFRRFLRNSFKDLPSLDEQSVWWNMLSPEPIQMGGAVDHARKDNNFRVALAHWAMAELLLASHGIMGVRSPAVRRAASLEKRVIGEFASRAPKDRLIRAVKALALLRAAGSSLSDPAEAKGIGVNQERDIHILFSATGASGLSLWESIETAYNEVLRQAGTSDVWRSLAENHSGLSSGEGSQALSSPTTVYFNVDALLDNSPNRRHVVEALKGQLLARREGAEKNRLVLITSQKDLLKTMGVKTEQELLLKWGRDWRWSHGPAIDALKEVGLLYDGSPSLKQGLISSTQVVSREGISTTVRSFRLEALQAHSNAMGNSAFELWTDDPGRVDKGNVIGPIVVDLMKMGESIDRALKAVRFLAISA